MSAPSRDTLRRGWCPSTLKPMETGDGWLVRLHLPGARLTPAQLRRIAALAREHGNGLIEISARGNMQLRGITAKSHPALVETLLAERLVDEHEGDGPQRLTLVSPLAQAALHCEERSDEAIQVDAEHAALDCFAEPVLGLAEGKIRGLAKTHSDLEPPSSKQGSSDLMDATCLAADIETRGRTIAGLPAKFSVVVDGGGASSLDAVACDIRVLAVAPGLVAIGLADRIWLGPIPKAQADAVVVDVLIRFAALRGQAQTAVRRLHDLPQEALAALSDLPAAVPPAPRSSPSRAGLFWLSSAGFAALVGLPFGRVDAATLDRLGGTALAHGCTDIRLSPWRGIAFRGMAQADATALLTFAHSVGLIVRDDDPRLSVQACAGAPACLRAETSAMTDASQLADAIAPLLAEGLTLHVSGCVKSCARPGTSDLTLVGRDARYGVIIGGTARDSAIAELDLSALVTRLQPGQEIHARLVAAGLIAGPRV